MNLLFLLLLIHSNFHIKQINMSKESLQNKVKLFAYLSKGIYYSSMFIKENISDFLDNLF